MSFYGYKAYNSVNILHNKPVNPGQCWIKAVSTLQRHNIKPMLRRHVTFAGVALLLYAFISENLYKKRPVFHVFETWYWLISSRHLVIVTRKAIQFKIPYPQSQSWCTLPYQVWPSDYQSDLDNRCVWSRYEKEGCEQHEYSLWRYRFTDCSVEVTLRSDCLGCLNSPGRRGVLNS